MGKKIVSYFFQGVLVIAPLTITVYVIYFLVTTIDNTINDYLQEIIGKRIFGLGLVMGVLAITVVGFLSSTLLFRLFFSAMDNIVNRTPLIKIVYSSLKDLFSSFFSDKKKFDQPAMISMIRGSGIYKMGFITQKDLSSIGVKDKIAVYLPHSYNFSGNLYVVDADLVEPIHDVSPADAMKFIVSGGVTEFSD
jgi:uncharacterized membrane protein